MATTTKTTTIVIIVVVVISLISCRCGSSSSSVVVISSPLNDVSLIADDESDNRFLDRLSRKERQHVEQEFLNILGLEHTPNPPRREVDHEAAPLYMMALYKNVQRRIEDETESSSKSGIARNNARKSVRNIDDTSSNSSMTEAAATSGMIEGQLNSADTIISFSNQAQHTHGGRLPYNYSSRPNWAVECYFDMSQVSVRTHVLTSAILRIYRSPTSMATTTVEKFKIEVRLIIKEPRTNYDDRSRARSLTFPLSKSGWMNVNVTHLTKDWMRNPSENRGLVLRVYDYKGQIIAPSSVGIAGDEADSDRQMFLVGFFKTNPYYHQTTTTRTRSRRSTDNNNNNNKNHRSKQNKADVFNDEPDHHHIWYQNKNDRKCQKRSLYVSFKDLNWQDWIIAPEGYAAYYCDGVCSFPLHAHMNATNHAIVQTLAYLMNPAFVPKPCCAPTKLSPLSVLYFDDNSNVILKKYRNMVVRACGCH